MNIKHCLLIVLAGCLFFTLLVRWESYRTEKRITEQCNDICTNLCAPEAVEETL